MSQQDKTGVTTMRIIDMAMGVNLSAFPKSRTAEQFSEKADDLYNYCSKHVEEVLSLSDNDGYHTGMAFFNIISRLKESEREEKYSYDDKKLKFSLYCSVICLWKGIQMGTMQSCIAADTLIHTIDNYKDKFFVKIFMQLTGFSLGEMLEHDSEDLKKRIETIYKHIKYYLIQITRADDAFKDANIEACKKGERYLNAMCDCIKDILNAYCSIGML